MKALVTGGSGFIGSAVVGHLLASGVEVVNLDALTYAASPAASEGWRDDPRYMFVKADIRDFEAMRAVFAAHRPDAVMHLAAETHVDRSIDGPDDFFETNIRGTYNLLRAARGYHDGLPRARRERFRFHHVSTDEVFGALDDDAPPFTEDHPYRPRSPYSATKAAADHLVRAWGETYGLPVVLSNCSNNYGPWQHPEKLIPNMILRARAGDRLPVYGDGRNVRDWLYVGDHARALALVLAHGRIGQSYNIGGGQERRNIEVVRAICELMDKLRPERAPHERLISFVPDRPGHDHRYAVDSSKVAQELGWRPERSFEAGLAETVGWYLAAEPWWSALLAREGGHKRLGLMAAAGG